MSKQKWKSDPSLYNCKRDKNNKKKLDYYDTYIREFLSADPVRDWESIDRCIQLWKWCKSFIDIDKKTKVLDCGTKDGQFAEWLEGQGYFSLGIEIDDQYVEYAQSLDRPVLKGDVCNIAIEDNFFDVVFSHHVLGLCPDYKKAYQEMVRVCKPNGLIISCNDVPGNPKKHYSLISSIKELDVIFKNIDNVTFKYYDYWLKEMPKEFLVVLEKNGITE